MFKVLLTKRAPGQLSHIGGLHPKNIISLTTSFPRYSHCLNILIAAKSEIQEEQLCRARQFQAMGKSLEDKMDRARQSRAQRSL